MHFILEGRLSGGGGGDRKLSPHHHTHSITSSQNHRTLKCPRCDSLNTKFCYYNNYNLSQPRHFCRNCRRYWTQGGLLRKVPVGGGCRKSKRSNPNSSSSAAATPAPPPSPSSSQPEHECKTSNSQSGRESSSLAAAAVFFSTEAVPGVTEQGGDSGIVSEKENSTNLITNTYETLAFGYGSITDASSVHQDSKFPEMNGWLLDQTVPVDLSTLIGDGGLGPLDWQGSSGTDHEGLFDLSNTEDEAFWSYSLWVWNEDDPSFFRLP